jgi:hypothetical protein
MGRPLSYNPLDPQDHQIRLLEITSPAASIAIQCVTHTVDLDAAPEYKALSYVWGPRENLQHIRVNGHGFMIRPNLFDFLQVYKKRGDRGWIWIDQLCIDQDSTSEKNHQVAIMGHIYRGARETLMWLGLDPDQGRAFSILDELSLRHSEGHKHNVCQGDDKKALETLLDRPYWTRHWIAQEVMLSTDCVLCYGDNEMSFEEMNNALSNDSGLDFGSFSGYDSLTFLLDSLGYFSDSPPGREFEGISSFVQTSLCENPRDKVYGIQSLLHPSKQLPVDYHIGVDVLYLQVVKLWFNHSQGDTFHSFLSYCIWYADGMGLAPSRPVDPDSIQEEILHYFSLLGREPDLTSDGYQKWMPLEEVLDFLRTRVLSPDAT